MGIVFNYIDPVAFNLGPLSVRWYGIIIAVGILLGYFVAQRALVKAGLHKDTLVDIIFYSALFGFIAARIYFVIFQWPYYAENPGEIIKIWHGGIAIHGGLIGGFIAGVIVC
ncbi:prolipoprotein diacylglyceryl transferase family protein, partial [Staphylococcus aureus]